MSPPPVAWRRILLPAAVVVVVLTAFSTRYGYERDELYFSMLRPAWGYVDQPPLTPLLSHFLVSVYDGQPWLLRVPATLCAAGCAVLTALIARELGGGARAQTWAAWGVATTSAATLFGHSFLTSTPDLVFWPAVSLCVVRALRREQPRWWLVAGAVAGVATYNKLLVGVLVGSLALGLLLLGPRSRLRAPWPWVGAALALVIGLPNVVYQVGHGWPELDMGHALSAHNGADVRVSMWYLLVLLFGPPLAVIWAVGLVRLWRDRAVRCFVVAFAAIVVFTFVSGTQAYYPIFLLPVPFAAGVVALEHRLGRVWAALFAVNGVVSMLIGLPVIPVSAVGSTPVPDINLTAADSIGWRAYADEVAQVFHAPPDDVTNPQIVFASNYGEAGAVARFHHDLPVYSAHNGLYDEAVPPESATTVVVVGDQLAQLRRYFAACTVAGRLDAGVDIDNEEEGLPIAVCVDRQQSWATIWPRLRHLD